jgi:hypothetical protein
LSDYKWRFGSILEALRKPVMTALQSYSYKTDSVNRYEYNDGSRKYFFRITSITPTIAAIQFFSDNKYTVQIPPPAGFQVRDTAEGLINPFINSFFVIWISNYEMMYNGVVIWKLTNQKEQEVTAKNGCTIIT